MDSTAGLRNLPERGDQSQEGGGGGGDSTGHEEPGVLWLKPQSGGRKSCLQCVRPFLCRSSRVLEQLGSWKGDFAYTYWCLLVFSLRGSHMSLLTSVSQWVPKRSWVFAQMQTCHARPGCPQQAHREARPVSAMHTLTCALGFAF